MNLLSLAQLFGKGAYQDANVLIIQKADLLRLSPSAINRAESLLVAILVTALENFNADIIDENNHSITNENNQPITCDNSETFELINMIEWQPFKFNRGSQPFINNQIIFFSYAPN